MILTKKQKRLKGIETIILQIIKNNRFQTTNKILKKLKERDINTTWITVKSRLDELHLIGRIDKVILGNKREFITWIPKRK